MSELLNITTHRHLSASCTIEAIDCHARKKAMGKRRKGNFNFTQSSHIPMSLE